jgi:hypothetical protein
MLLFIAAAGGGLWLVITILASDVKERKLKHRRR